MKRFRGQRSVAMLVAVVAGLSLILAVAAVFRDRSDSPSAGGGRQPGPIAGATIDPRLILRRQALPIQATLGAHLELSGTLYPSVPGMNTLRLRLGGAATVVVSKAQAPHISVTMPGMPMKPINAVLTRSGGMYVGSVPLPMLGYYKAEVSMVVDGSVMTGTMQLAVPL